MDITKVFALMNNCCVKADNSSTLYSFSGIGCAHWLSDKIFSESYEYIGKKGAVGFRIDSPGRCKQYYLPLSK